MIHLVKQYKQLFNFCLMANTDFGKYAPESNSEGVTNKEVAKGDRDKLTYIPGLGKKAEGLAKGLESKLSQTYNLNELSFDKSMNIRNNLKPGDTVYTSDVYDISQLKAKGINAIYKSKSKNKSEGSTYSDPNITSDGFRVGDGPHSY